MSTSTLSLPLPAIDSAYERSMPNFPSINSIMRLSRSCIFQASASYSRRRFRRAGRRSSSPAGLLAASAIALTLLVRVAASASTVAFLVLFYLLLRVPLHVRTPTINIPNMESTTDLKSITVGQQNCRVITRLIRTWDAINMNPRYGGGLISIDGILLDEDGIMAQISVPKKYEKQFRPMLSQGYVYLISDIAAIDIRSKSYVYHHQKYMLQFKHDTKVHPLHSRGENIPALAFDFCPFDQLPAKAIDSKPLLDIIGVISDVGPYEYASPMSQKKLRKIKIRNLDEQTQELVLWRQHGESFDENTVLQKSKGIVVVIFAGMTATLQKFTGMIQGSSSSATQVYLNLDIPEAQKYNSSYKWKCPTLHKHLPQVRQVSPLEAAGKVYTIGQIISQPTSSFEGGATLSTIAKVTSIVPSVKWYYKACKHCGKGYNNVSDTATCTCQFPVPRPMYKLPLTLTDSSGSLDAIAFSKVGEDLVERLAEQVCMNMKIDAADHVVTLDNAIGKERLFYIGMNTESAGKYPINYVLKRSFPVNNTDSQPVLTAPKPNDTNLLSVPTSSSMIPLSPVAHKQDASYVNTPPIDTKTSDHIKEPETRSAAKRSINFTEVDAATIKRQKQQYVLLTRNFTEFSYEYKLYLSNIHSSTSSVRQAM